MVYILQMRIVYIRNTSKWISNAADIVSICWGKEYLPTSFEMKHKSPATIFDMEVYLFTWLVIYHTLWQLGHPGFLMLLDSMEKSSIEMWIKGMTGIEVLAFVWAGKEQSISELFSMNQLLVLPYY